MEIGQQPLSIRVVTDGRAGIENQSLGLAEAVGRLTPAQITVRRVRWRPAFNWLPVRLKSPRMLDPAGDTPFPMDGESWPDLWIATGRASLPLSTRAKALSGGRTFVVQTQDPGLDPARFDLVVAPAHDRLDGPDVLSITGSPNRITAERLTQAGAVFAERLAALPRPHVAVLIGGRSRAFDLTEDHALVLADQIAGAVQAVGGSILLTFSRRTPKVAQSALNGRLADLPGWIWDGAGANPLFAFLHTADHILVTEDSANMAAEAATTGKPVHLLPMVGRKAPGKFARLQADLTTRGAVRPFDGTLMPWTYSPLAETDRAARIILERMGRL